MGLKNPQQGGSGGLRPEGLKSLTVDAVPDGTILSYPIDEGSGTAINEREGKFSNQDFTTSGDPSWVSDQAWWKDTYLDFDSSDDDANGPDWGDYGSTTFANETAIIVEIGNLKEAERVLTFSMAGGNNVRIGTDDFTTNNQNGPDGEIGLRYRDGNKNDIIFSSDKVFYDSTGTTREFIVFQFQNLDPSTGEIYINDGFVSTSNKKDQGPNAEDITDVIINDTVDGHNWGRLLVTDRMFTESELDTIAQRHGLGP